MGGPPPKASPSRRATLDAGKLGQPGLLRIHRWETPAADCNFTSMLHEELDIAAARDEADLVVVAVRGEPEARLGARPRRAS